MPSSALPSRVDDGRLRSRLRQLAVFGVVGGICFLIDVAVFHALYVHVGVDAVATKFVATSVSMTAAFVGHRSWSFAGHARTGLRREYSRFVGINAVTMLLGLAIVGFARYPLGQEDALVLQAVNVLAIAVGTVVRYLAYRRWVFPAVPHPVTDPASEIGPKSAASVS